MYFLQKAEEEILIVMEGTYDEPDSVGYYSFLTNISVNKKYVYFQFRILLQDKER